MDSTSSDSGNGECSVGRADYFRIANYILRRRLHERGNDLTWSDFGLDRSHVGVCVSVFEFKQQQLV
jgi:hypothetical protein